VPKSLLRSVAFVAVFALVGCESEQRSATAPALEPASPTFSLARAQQRELGAALAAKDRHADSLLADPGIVGLAVGLTADGRPAVKIFTKAAGTRGLPRNLDGIPVIAEVTGEFRAFPVRAASAGALAAGNTGTFAFPVPIGISTGNEGQCLAGTISARVRDAAGHLYALSNNHVYALENDARLGSRVLQPGLYDTGCSLTGNGVLGTLFDYQRIAFRRKANNTIDAAIATATAGTLGTATPGDGYGMPNHVTAPAFVSQPVQKYGRTTSLTHGRVTAVGATLLIGYTSGTARFVDQIIVESGTAFIGPGDSGSLLVSDDGGAYPVGLLFAGTGTGTMAIANPINAVLGRFGVTIDGK
jgi:hypothetical protein